MTYLMDAVRRRLEDRIPPYLGVLTAGLSVIRRRARLTSSDVDPLAEWCADEGIVLLRETQPRLFEAYVCLEIAAAREREVFGSTFRSYHDQVMRAVLGAAREAGLMANVADTTVDRWMGRNRPLVRAELRGYELRVYLEDGRTIILDRDLGMNEDYDA